MSAVAVRPSETVVDATDGTPPAAWPRRIASWVPSMVSRSRRESPSMSTTSSGALEAKNDEITGSIDANPTPVVQSARHSPSLQRSVPAHAWLHAPQCETLVSTFTHAPLHAVMHCWPHTPFVLQTPRSLAVALLQTPQVGPQPSTESAARHWFPVGGHRLKPCPHAQPQAKGAATFGLVQVRIEFGGPARHGVQLVPQESTPLSGTQVRPHLWKPGSHATSQRPWEHTAAPFVGVWQVSHAVPQVVTESATHIALQ